MMVDKLHDQVLKREADYQWARIDDAVAYAKRPLLADLRVAQDSAARWQALAVAHEQEAREAREKLAASEDAGTLHRWRVHAASMAQERAAASRALQDEQELRKGAEAALWPVMDERDDWQECAVRGSLQWSSDANPFGIPCRQHVRMHRLWSQGVL